MSVFACAACRAEYENPEDRRFHAEPTACPVCGPRVWLEEGDRSAWTARRSLEAAAGLLKDGKIVAVKGLGGFHLAADARQDEAVATLRERKGRVAKPFALMVRDLAAGRALCATWASRNAAAPLPGTAHRPGPAAAGTPASRPTWPRATGTWG